MPKLRDVLYGVPPTSSQGQTCKLAAIRESLDEEDQTLLDDWLESEDYSGRLISNLLHRAGKPVSPSLINEHISRLCRCYRAAA